MRSRSEIKEQYKSDMTSIYANEEEVFNDIKKLDKIVNDLLKYKGKVLQSGKNLLDVFKLNEQLELISNKIIVYCFFSYDLDMTNTKYKENLDKYEDYRINFVQKLSFIDIELKKITKKKWKLLKSENSELEIYDYYINEIIRMKSHKLKPHDEQFLTNLYKIFGSNDNAYEILTNADFKCEDVTIDGKKEKLTESNYYKFMVNKDREVRKSANTNLLSFYESHKHTITELYKMFIKENNTLAKIFKYNNSLESELFENNISIDVYKGLIKFVKDNVWFNKKYLSLLKKDLELDTLYSYDVLYNKHSSKEYSYEQSIDLVTQALSILNEKYMTIFKNGIDKRWIDVFPSEHKNSTQYSINMVGVSPLIHLNFNGTFEDISTIAHEMGHSVHSILSRENNDFVYSNASTLLTETAALVNELLLANYILDNSHEKEEKLFILNHILSNIRGTVFSQTLLAEFEMEATIKDAEGEILTVESLSDMYLNLSAFYSKNEIKYTNLSKYSWMSIPHLFSDGGFYVYKYALGYFLASSIVFEILNGDDSFKEKYIKFLESGSRKSDTILLKDLGLDITKSDYMEKSLKLFEKYLTMYEELLK